MAQDQDVVLDTGPVLVTIPIQRTGNKYDAKFIGNQLLQYLQKMIAQKYPSSLKAIYKVVPSYIVTDIRVVETMDRRVYADLEIYTRLRGVGFHKDSLLRMYSATGSGESENAAIQKAANAILSPGGPVNKFMGVMDSLFRERYDVHGVATLASLKKLPLTTLKECDNVLGELVYFDHYPSMADHATAFRNELLKKRSEIFCATELPALKIKIESTVYNLNETVDKLLSVSPEASCSGELLKLAQLIGKQQIEKQASVPQQLTLLISVHQDHNINLWRESRY